MCCRRSSGRWPRVEGVRVAIKTHPAETADAYAAAVAGLDRIAVLPAASPLAPLLAVSRVVVTVNSTVALDAAVLGMPALVTRAAEQSVAVRRGWSDAGGCGRRKLPPS